MVTAETVPDEASRELQWLEAPAGATHPSGKEITMKMRWTIGLAAMAYLSSSAMLAAQERSDGQPSWYFLVEEKVKPSMMEQYEKATKDMIKELEKHGHDDENLHFSTVFGPEMGYVFVIPIESIGASDQVMAAWQGVKESIGDRWQKLEDRASEAVDHRAAFHVVHRPDLSYAPEKPQTPRGEATFISYHFYYAIPGKEREIEKVAQEFAKLYERKGLNDGWSVYQCITGDDLPLYVVAHPSSSQDAYYARKAEIAKAMGDDAQKLEKRAMSATRRLEQKVGWIRPDLSFPAAPKE